MGTDYTVVKDGPVELSVVSDQGYVQESKLPRRQLTIANSTLKDLEKPASEKSFAERLRNVEAKNPLKAHLEAAAAAMVAAEANSVGGPRRFAPARQYPARCPGRRSAG